MTSTRWPAPNKRPGLRKDITDQLSGSGRLNVKADGYVDFQVIGAGAVGTVTINGVTGNINSGTLLVTGAVYEFSITVSDGDVIIFSPVPYKIWQVS